MKNYYIGALATIASAFIIHPFLNMVAIAERGYDAIGGEECIFILAFVIAAVIIQTGIDRRRREEKHDDEKEE